MQPLDGPFTQWLQASRSSDLTVIACVHMPAPDGRVWNTLVGLRDGAVLAQYRKLHRYDAFAMQESTHVIAGQEI